MRTRALIVLTTLSVLTTGGAASAATQLGITVKPNASSGTNCPAGVIMAQGTDDPSTPYIVPAGGGFITAWDVNTSAGGPPASVTFVVLRPVDPTHYSVVGADMRSLPSPFPMSNVASFTLSSPIAVQAGDTFGLFGGTGIDCAWTAGSTPSGDKLQPVNEPTAPTVGQTLSTPTGSSSGYAVNAGAILERSDDLAVSTATAPSAPRAGNLPCCPRR